MRKIKTTAAFAAFATAIAGGTAQNAFANDGIFPPAPSAKAAIDFDGRGFWVNGKRTFIASGTIHYPRVPRALWRDRLLRLKRAGFNTVETYAFWNYHEEREGQFDFKGEKDFGAFLQTAQDVGLYVIVRVGPYVCAEWQSGGYPEWLRFAPGVRVREDNPRFVKAVDAWYGHILPIVAAHQIHRGGSVIMVQLENEHPLGWGTEMPNGYFTHLLAKSRAEKIEVPTFFSGLHHGADPAPRQPISSQGRTNPWFTTEFWPGWYDLYGPLRLTGNRSLRQFERGTWRVLANGGNGYNFYMLHGGTNFGTWNSNEDASSYDYGGAIGQTGDLRPIYYRFKRANLFATSFADVLENSDNASADFQNFAPGVTVTARKNARGETLVFLDNPTNDAVTTKLASGDEIRLQSGETVGLAQNVALNDQFLIKESTARILGYAQQGDTTTLVAYGQAGEKGSVHIVISPKAAADKPTNVILNLEFKDGEPTPYLIGSGTKKLRVLAMTTETADRTFFVSPQNAKNANDSYVVCGADYVGDLTVNRGQASLTAEEPAGSAGAPTVLVYGANDDPQRLTPPKMGAGEGSAPSLQNWQAVRADAEAAPNYNDARWKASPAPLPMGADGDTSAYAWYRTTLVAPKAGEYRLNFSDVGDWAWVYVNGQAVGGTTPKQRLRNPVRATVPVHLEAGNNTLAVLTAHYGRDKLFNFLGPIDAIDVKGLGGPVTLEPGGGTTAPQAAITNWRWRTDDRGEVGAAEITAADAKTDGPNWQDAAPGKDVFNGRAGFTWFTTTLTTPLAGPGRVLHFEDVDDNATVYLNGVRLAKHSGWGEPFDVPLDAAWHDGPNTLVVLVENTAGAGGIMGAVELRKGAASDAGTSRLQNWKLRGGLSDVLGGKTAWQPLATPTQGGVTASPMFYRASFAAPPAQNTDPIVRVSLAGMGRGFVWLNGHNLGRYPEKVPVDGLYLPENWIKATGNELIVLDETGASPTQVKLRVENAASRRIIRYGR